MKINRVVLIAIAFLVLGSGLVISRVWTSNSAQDLAAAKREEMATPSNGDSTDASSGAIQGNRIAAADGPVLLDAGSARVTLKSAEPGVTLSSHLRSLAVDKRVTLIIGEMSAAEQPGVPYEIFFDLPSGGKADVHSANYVGTITFFNAVKLEGAAPNSNDPRFFSFDVTGIIRTLQSKKMLTEDTTIVVKPAGTPAAEAKARIARLELIEQ
ncbi:MAG TPA: hypothetical protein VN743_09930 [Blastocatellia bacterium]|jgi:hypothetical protein|nr:hypothetical protein [Blastocatellia bacterium]